MSKLIVRASTEADVVRCAEIYAHHVLHGTASYDIDPPSLDQIRDKMQWILGQKWPFLLAELDGAVAGYAYATQFRDRAAYRFTCENSIYVRPDCTGRGIGHALLNALVDRSGDFGFRTMIAVIGGAEPASVALHAACGFDEVGRLKAVGWKKERWLDNVYMQRNLVPQRD